MRGEPTRGEPTRGEPTRGESSGGRRCERGGTTCMRCRLARDSCRERNETEKSELGENGEFRVGQRLTWLLPLGCSMDHTVVCWAVGSEPHYNPWPARRLDATRARAPCCALARVSAQDLVRIVSSSC